MSEFELTEIAGWTIIVRQKSDCSEKREVYWASTGTDAGPLLFLEYNEARDFAHQDQCFNPVMTEMDICGDYTSRDFYDAMKASNVNSVFFFENKKLHPKPLKAFLEDLRSRLAAHGVLED